MAHSEQFGKEAASGSAALALSQSQPGRDDHRPPLADAELADSFREQSFHLMTTHPIAAAHLVLAAASIAPECEDERNVADEFSYVIADFVQMLGILHRRAVLRRASEPEGSDGDR